VVEFKRTIPMVLIGIMLVAACTSEPEAYPDQPDTRLIEKAPEPSVVVSGGIGDTILLKPGLGLDIRDERIGVIDLGRMAVEMFDLEGNLLWVAGKKGGGPTEFEGPESLSIDREGRTWVLDGKNLRVTPIDRDGRMEVPFPIPSSPDELNPGGVMVLDDGQLLFTWITSGRQGLWNPTTSVAQVLPNPWTSSDDYDPLSIQTTVVRGPGQMLTHVFLMGGGFQSFALGDQFEHLVPFVERTPLPKIRTERRRDGTTFITIRSIDASYGAALSAAISGNTLYVLAEGATQSRRRLIDRYEVPSGRYLGSWRIPQRAMAIDVEGDVMVTLEGRVLPQLVIRRIPQGD
jgi:hypothetical protein